MPQFRGVKLRRPRQEELKTLNWTQDSVKYIGPAATREPSFREARQEALKAAAIASICRRWLMSWPAIVSISVWKVISPRSG